MWDKICSLILSELKKSFCDMAIILSVALNFMIFWNQNHISQLWGSVFIVGTLFCINAELDIFIYLPQSLATQLVLTDVNAFSRMCIRFYPKIIYIFLLTFNCFISTTILY